jgi:hypothetical protein
MSKVLKIVLYVVSGFFIYMECVLAFISELPPIAKAGIMAVFAVPVLLAHFGGLAADGFRNWKRDTGIVLVSAAGFSTFLVFSFACFLMTDEFRKMMKPDTLSFFRAYVTGFCFIFTTGAAGLVLLRMAKQQSKLSILPLPEPSSELHKSGL